MITVDKNYKPDEDPKIINLLKQIDDILKSPGLLLDGLPPMVSKVKSIHSAILNIDPDTTMITIGPVFQFIIPSWEILINILVGPRIGISIVHFEYEPNPPEEFDQVDPDPEPTLNE